MRRFFIIYILWVSFFMSCSVDKTETLFRQVHSAESGVTFANKLDETPDFNIFNYLYFYNGGGVAVGDVNGDDLPDIYFTSNQGPNKLYINLGDFRFKDVSKQAGVEGFKGWSTGVTMADVNGDGKLDIYVCHLGDYLIYNGRNQLFINEGNDENGIPRFTDQAMEYGLDLVGFSTQATFFDFDLDGDLDMYMLNHSTHKSGTFGKSDLRYKSHPMSGDVLLRNDNGRFVNVTEASGIYSSVLGYGLGVVVSDVNLDGLPDIYVGNDFHENDYLYINLGNGKFKEVLEQSMMHNSHFSMGCDFADFNNDGFPDLISVDMLPENPRILKASAAEDPYDVYMFKRRFGYSYQFARNNLQLNQQDGTFSEIGLFSGVAATDWSWAALFADFDLDGNKDILIANGIRRRSNDLDYINFITVDTIQYRLDEVVKESDLEFIKQMPMIKLPNYLYRNNGDSTFTNKAIEWGLNASSYSNGAVYADLDNDGDLDIVINNIDDEAFIYENRSLARKENLSEHNFLKIKLQGKEGNNFGIGAKVFLYHSEGLQMQECMPTRGFQSSVDSRLNFGLGKEKTIDSLVVIWPDKSYQTINNVSSNQTLTLHQKDAGNTFDYTTLHHRSPIFTSVDPMDIGLSFIHRENEFVEFNREALLPHMVSAEGPAVAIGDVNGDGLEDIFLGGAKWQEGRIFLQKPGGKFEAVSHHAIAADSTAEDVDAVFIDVDNDNDLDLIVVSGGNEFSGKSRHMLPRLYLNDGKGNFSRAEDALPELFITGSCVKPIDYDGDGDLDLFIGARAVPWKFGIKPDSYLLENDGTGKFKDVTDAKAPGLRSLGFVKDAVWADVDGDKIDDLVIAGEWMPITIFLNRKGKLEKVNPEESGLLYSEGLWNTIVPVDFDGDGDIDFVAGNLGLNSKLKTSRHEPVRMYVKDFDGNGSLDQVLSHYMQGKEYPFHTKDELAKQMPYLKKKFLSYAKFAEASLNDIFGKDDLAAAELFTVYQLENSVVENLGNGRFSVKPLPRAAQFSTINAMLSEDIDQDGNPDILAAGNFYRVNIQMGRYDASYGVVMRGNGNSFTVLPQADTGWFVTGEVRKMRKVRVGKDLYYLAVRNNDSVQMLKRKQ